MSSGVGKTAPALAVHMDPMRQFFRGGLIVLAVFCLGWVAIGLPALLARGDAPRALVAPEAWTASGDFVAISGYSDALAIPPVLFEDPAYRFWQALGTNENPAHGDVVSAPFAPARFIAVPYAGAPDEVEGNRIVIQCVGSGAEFPVSRFRMNDQRATSFVELPQAFCSGDVRLVASVAGAQFISVGTPFEISESAYRNQTEMLPRALVVILTWAASMLVWFLSGFVSWRYLSERQPAAAGMAGGAIVAMIFIAAFTVGPVVGATTVYLVAALTLTAAVLVPVSDPAWSIRYVRRIAPGALLWLLIALLYASVVTAADNGGGSWWINGVFTPLRWSSDNQIPHQMAEMVFQGRPAADIHWGPWLATDRTPLLSGLLLAIRVLIIAPCERPFGPTFVPTAYMMSSIVFLSVWVLVLVEIVKNVDRRSLAILFLLACTTPFLFFNSVYAWPKMLGAAYVLASFGCLFDWSTDRRRNPKSMILLALLAMGAILAHSSNAFALVPIALIFSRTLLRQGVVAIVAGVVAATLLAAPWLYWQIVLQPGGNALLRFALAYDGDVVNRGRSLLSAIRDVYASMSLAEWYESKRSSLALMLGLEPSNFAMQEIASHSPGAGPIGTARVNDFFSVRHALSVAGLGLLAVPFLSLFARTGFAASSMARMAALAGLSGVLFGLLVMLPPGIVHHQPYGSLLLLVMAGALAIAAAPAWLAVGATVLSVGYFAVVWVWHPIATAVTVHGSAIMLMAWSAAAIGWLLFMRPRDADAALSGSSVETR